MHGLLKHMSGVCHIGTGYISQDRGFNSLTYCLQGLPFEEGGIPIIFQTLSIDIRNPKNEDGSAQSPLTCSNPLGRYQCKDEKGNLMLMGDLPKPYNLPPDKYTSGGPWLEVSKAIKCHSRCSFDVIVVV